MTTRADFSARRPDARRANSRRRRRWRHGHRDPGPLRIHDIQGTSWLSPHDGDQVTNVPASSPAIRSDRQQQGLLDSGPRPGLRPGHQRGDLRLHLLARRRGRRLGARVGHGQGLLPAGERRDGRRRRRNCRSPRSTARPRSCCRTATRCPRPRCIGPTTVPDTYAPDLGGGNIESTKIAPDPLGARLLGVARGDAGRGRRRPGGRSVRTASASSTSPPSRRRTRRFRGGTELLAENATPSGADRGRPRRRQQPGGQRRRRVQRRDGRSGRLLRVRRLHDRGHHGSAPCAQQPGARSSPPRRRAKQLAVATYNVENLAPSDPAAKFQRLAQGLVTNLAAPDIVAVEEVQDNTGATDDGVVAADQTLTKLTDGDHRGRRPALRLARDRPGQRPGRRPAGRQHPRGVPYNPARVHVRRPWRAVGEPFDHRHVGRSRSRASPT